MLDAVVLAGSENTGPLRECSPESSEAMIKIGSKQMVRYVVDALIASKNINKIVIVGSLEIKQIFPEEFIQVVNAKGTAIQNLLSGLAGIDSSRKAMVVACDIPLLTPNSVNDFINMSCSPEIDLYYPIVLMETVKSKFPEIKRTSVKLKEGTFTGGNIFIINPRAVKQCSAIVQKFVDLRKSPIDLCRLLGLNFVFKFLFNRLSILEIEKKVSSVLGIKGKAVITDHPEIGVDVDKPSDYAVVSSYLNKPA